jgi:membrane protein
MVHSPRDLPDQEPEASADPILDESDSTRRGLVAWSKAQMSSGQSRLSMQFAKHRHRPLVDVGVRIYHRDRESAGTVVGSAIAFRLFLFFVPLLLFIVGLAGFVATWVDAETVNDGAGLTGSLAVQINSALSQPSSTRWVAVLLGLVGMASTGRSLTKVLVATSCLAWRLPMASKASMRVVGAIVGVIAGIGLVATIVNRIRQELGLGVATVSFVGVLVVYALAWVVLSMMLPRASTDPGALLPGAALFGVTLAAMQAVSQLYLPNKLSRASELYGAIGTTIVTLGWFFILGRAIVLAMVLDAVIHERFGSISQVVFSLPLMRILPRKSAWVRRFFDLDDGGAADGDAKDGP